MNGGVLYLAFPTFFVTMLIMQRKLISVYVVLVFVRQEAKGFVDVFCVFLCVEIVKYFPTQMLIGFDIT